MTQKLRSRLMILVIAMFITIVGTLPYAFLTSDPSISWLVYPLACIQGVGIAMMLNTSTSLISDVVGKDSEQAAFVYGIYSFLDKIANGFLLYFLVRDYSYSNHALRLIVTIIPIGSAIGTMLCTWWGLALYSDTMAKISVVNSKQ